MLVGRPAIRSRPRAQSGVALIVVLILLIVTSILALNAVRFGAMQLRVATNDQLRITAYQNAQSVADATISNSSYTPVTGATGAVACTDLSVPGCSGVTNLITELPGSFMAKDLAAGNVKIKVERVTPACSQVPPSLGVSLKNWAAASFTADSAYAGDQRGSSEVREGVIVLFKLADTASGACS